MNAEIKQVGDTFGLQVNHLKAKTTAHYAQMAKLSKLLLDMDRHLLANLMPLKYSLNHILLNNPNQDQLLIKETLGLAADIEVIVGSYLRKGKELILSRLDTVSERERFDVLRSDLVAIANAAEQAVGSNLLMKDIACVNMDETDLIRLLNKAWTFFKTTGRVLEVEILSLAGQPRSGFLGDPQFEAWVEPPLSDQDFTGWFRPTIPIFSGKGPWKADLINGVEKSRVYVRIADPVFLEGLQSSEANAANGLLIGDVFKAKFRLEVDVLKNRKVYVINKVLHRVYASEMARQEEFNFA